LSQEAFRSLESGMKRSLLLLMATAALLAAGCADYGEPDPEERGPAPYSPDPTGHIPSSQNLRGDNPNHRW
jgi:hypothetical protein